MNLNEKKQADLLPENQITKLLSVLLQKNSDFKNKIFSVGGFVRDQILQIESNDLDIVVETPDGAEKFSKFIHALFPIATTNPFQKGLGYPIWYLEFKDDVTYQNKIYKTKNGAIDFADSQKECFPDPTSRQRITSYGNLSEDIMRRDFTINMLAQNLTNSEITDLSGSGIKDLKSGLIQCHPKNLPDQVFADDPLRMIRAVRFASKYNFQIHDSVKISIQKNAQRIKILSSERIWDEIRKIILNGNFHRALKMMIELGLFTQIFKNSDPLSIQFDHFDLSPKNIVTNLVALYQNSIIEQTELELSNLKVEKIIKNDVLMTLSGLTTLNQSFPADSRDFARRYLSQIKYLQIFKPDDIKKIQNDLLIPIQNAPVLNGHDIMTLFKASGPKIKIILNEALKIEDELILKYNLPPSDTTLQSEVLNQLKAQFLK